MNHCNPTERKNLGAGIVAQQAKALLGMPAFISESYLCFQSSFLLMHTLSGSVPGSVLATYVGDSDGVSGS